MLNILAIGAHPDDIEIGCGGTLLKYKDKGFSVFLLVLTDGQFGASKEVRKQEQIRSSKILDANEVFWGGYSDTRFPLDRRSINTIEDVLRKINPQFIFVNYYDDTHQDHRYLAEATISATRYIKNVLFYEVPTTQNFSPNVFVDINDVLEKKISLLKAHESQVMKTNIEDLSIAEIAKSSANFRGIQGRVKYAEGFRSLRLFINM
ncbi:MAG: PIG-L deacetylase family protein [Thermodesulfobacteriota bacterium]|nr:PIG-L deacetylase family protein [Thermodesulfobacteriota bacterium]